jgi:hypothetical protein
MFLIGIGIIAIILLLINIDHNITVGINSIEELLKQIKDKL